MTNRQVIRCAFGALFGLAMLLVMFGVSIGYAVARALS